MKVLILGATGATGSLVVRQTVKKNIQTKIVVRDIKKVPSDILNNKLVECFEGNVLEFSDEKNIKLVKDCDAVICCLGHNITLKGIYGKPRLLVTGSIINICKALKHNKKEKLKLVLMNTTANINRKINEKYSLKDRAVLFLLRYLLPPQNDNELAALFLIHILRPNNSNIEWVAVRPDGLINEEAVTDYEVLESPKRSPIFDPGKTSRINVSHFMSELLTDESLWEKWKYRMPVIYNN